MHLSHLVLLGLGISVSAGSSSADTSTGRSSTAPSYEPHSYDPNSSATQSSGMPSSATRSRTRSDGTHTSKSPPLSTSGMHPSGTISSRPSGSASATGNHTITISASISVNGAPGKNSTSLGGSSHTESSKKPAHTAVKFTAHPDGQCQKPLKGKDNSFEVDQGKGFPHYTTIKKPTFPGAEAKDGGGWNVYWSIPKPDEGCRYQVMLPYQQYSGTPGYPGGNEIINVGSEGCYFGNVPTDGDVYLTFCCGSGDCEKSSLNSTSLLSDPITKRRGLKSESPAKWSATTDVIRAADKIAEVKPRGGSLAASKSSGLEERFWYKPGPKPPKSTCTVIKPGQPYSRAGQQIIVGPSEVCQSSPCSVALAYTISYSTTATSSKSETLTNSIGMSVAIKAGVDFIAEMDVTTTLSTEMSDAITEATGMDVMRGNSSTVTNTISLALGNRGYVTFTPVYRCVTGPLDCGNGTVGPIDFCQPDLSGKNGSPAGDFYPLVSD